MSPRSIDTAAVLPLLREAAFHAGALLLEGWRRPGGVAVDYKGAIDLVTEFDRRSESLLRARFAECVPWADVVAEEEGGRAGGDRPVIWADPLDGTTNFAHGHPFFAVSIALAEADGRVVLGVVHAPALGWTWWGADGIPACRNGQTATPSRTDRLDRALLATGFPYDRATSPENNFREWLHLKRRVQGIRRCGSAAIDLCLVADGTYDGYWESKLQPWDLGAGMAIVQAAGGMVTARDGGLPDARTGSVVATNGPLHAALLEALDEASRTPRL